jgi:AcrR family transcriptional regulator
MNSRIAQTNGSEQTRQQILAAALRLFAAHGYAGTSTQAIIAASRVSKPVLYYHFGSKAGLFRVIADEAENQLLEVILKSKASAPDVRSQLVEICAAMFQFAREHPSLAALTLELSSISRQCPSPKQSRGKIRQWHSLVGLVMGQGINEGLLREQFSNEELAIGFRGLIRSHILHYLSHPQWPLNRAMAERVVALFLNGTAGALPLFPPLVTN